MVETIFPMLDSECDMKTQQEGIKMAEKCKDIAIFLQPMDSKYNKNIWYNCAQIICNRSDNELEHYLDKLLEWLQDLTWPGAFVIINRLKHFSGNMLLPYFEAAIKKCQDRPDDDNEWLDNLTSLIENPDLSKRLSSKEYKHLKTAGFICDNFVK